MNATYEQTARTTGRRQAARVAYDRDTVHAILDAALMCHVGYVIDGKPYVTPTLFWRDGERLYWHGSSASRMQRMTTSCRDAVTGGVGIKSQSELRP